MSPHNVSDELWGVVVSNIFNDKVGNAISSFWVRLVSMFSYKGFWEYEILGVVSILDAYSLDYHEKYTLKKLPKEEYQKLKNEMVKVLDAYKLSNLPISIENGSYLDDCQVIDGMIFSLGTIRNTNAPNFKSAFDGLMNSIDKDIRDLIGLGSDEFRLIQNIRNLAAHGQAISKNIRDNLQKVIVVKEKVKFLLLYIVFILLGFTKETFINACGNSFHKIRLNAQLDALTLSKLKGTAKFFELNNTEFIKAKALPLVDISLIYHSK